MAALHGNSTKKKRVKFDSMIDRLTSGGVWAVPENGLPTGSTFGSEYLPVKSTKVQSVFEIFTGRQFFFCFVDIFILCLRPSNEIC